VTSRRTLTLPAAPEAGRKAQRGEGTIIIHRPRAGLRYLPPLARVGYNGRGECACTWGRKRRQRWMMGLALMLGRHALFWLFAIVE